MMEHHQRPNCLHYGKLKNSNSDDTMQRSDVMPHAVAQNGIVELAPSEEYHQILDPFEDPTLVTTAFIDIHCQDADGNSALMLAAIDNRILHVKGILTMAANTRKLWEVLEMRNNEGLTAWDLAVRANSNQSANIIAQFAKEYFGKTNKLLLSRTRPISISSNSNGSRMMETNEKDITFEFDDSPQNQPRQTMDSVFSDNQSNESSNSPKTSNNDTKRAPFPLLRRLSRDRMQNHKRIPPIDLLKRSKSYHSRMVPQKPCDLLASSSENETYSPPLPAHPPDAGVGVLSTVGAKLRDMFSTRRDKLEQAKLDQKISEVLYNNGLTNTVLSHLSQEQVKLPQHSSSSMESREESDMFRSSPWGISVASSTSAATAHPPPCGIRLPPLVNLGNRRRAASESRRRSKFVIPESAQ